MIIILCWCLKPHVGLLEVIMIISVGVGSEIMELAEPNQFAYTRPSTAFHLEIDLAEQEQLVAAYVASLGIIKENDREPHKIIGGGTKGYQDGRGQNAQFRLITGFAQVNTTYIVLVDHENHCLRSVSRPQGLATTLAGRCGRPGYINGEFLLSKFYQPYNIEKISNSTLLVTDHNNNAIREINLETRTVITWLQSEDLEFPIDLLLDTESNLLYVTLRFEIVYVDLDDKSVNHISSDRCDKIVMYSPGVMLLTENPRDFQRNGYKSRIRQLIHTNSTPTVNDLIEWPTPNEPPLAIACNRTTRQLYVSERQAVRSVYVRGIGDPPFTIPYTATTTKSAMLEIIGGSMNHQTLEPMNSETTYSECLDNCDKKAVPQVAIWIAIFASLLICFAAISTTTFLILRRKRRPQQGSEISDNNGNEQRADCGEATEMGLISQPQDTQDEIYPPESQSMFGAQPVTENEAVTITFSPEEAMLHDVTASQPDALKSHFSHDEGASSCLFYREPLINTTTATQPADDDQVSLLSRDILITQADDSEAEDSSNLIC